MMAFRNNMASQFSLYNNYHIRPDLIIIYL